MPYEDQHPNTPEEQEMLKRTLKRSADNSARRHFGGNLAPGSGDGKYHAAPFFKKGYRG